MGTRNGAAVLEKSLAVSYKVTDPLPVNPEIPPSGMYPREGKTRPPKDLERDVCTSGFIDINHNRNNSNIQYLAGGKANSLQLSMRATFRNVQQ